MKFNHRLSSIWVFVVDIEIKCTVFHELLYTRNVGAEFVYGFFSISKWSDASKTGCRVKGKGGDSGKKKRQKDKKKKTPPLEDDGEPEKHSDRSCRTSDKRLARWRLGCFNTKRLELEILFPIVFFWGLVFIVFLWCCGHNRWKNKKIRDENHHGQQHRGLSLMVISTIQWHWQFSVSSVRAYYYSPFACYIFFKNSNLLLYIFIFLRN